MSCDRLTVTWEVSTIAWIPLLPSNGLSKAMISISRPVGKSTHVKTHKLLQVVKQVVTNMSNKLSTSCVRTACSQLLQQIWIKLLTTCNKLDGIIGLDTRLC